MSISNTIEVDYDPKNKRLLFKGAFYLLDVFRSFPSRRFDPKAKVWRVPLVKQNLVHFENTVKNRYNVSISEQALAAIKDLESLTAKPVYLPYPVQYAERMKLPPLEHQWSMLDRGWNLRAYALFAAMGTGKTYTTIATAMGRFWDDQIDSLTIISPQTLHNTWRKEFAKYAPAGSYAIHQVVSGRADLIDDHFDLHHGKLRVYLVSVEGLGISEKYYDTVCGVTLRGRSRMVVCDESSRIKNPDAKRTERTIKIASACQFTMLLNGTPIAKGIQDLYSQYEFLDPTIIGSGDYWAFKTRYVVMGGYENKQIVGYANVEELMELIQPYTLEVNKSVLKLPPKVYKQRFIEPTKEQRKIIDQIMAGGVSEADPFIKVQNTLERMLRIQQVVGGFRPVSNPDTLETVLEPLSENPKIKDLMEFIDDHYLSSKFIIWARYIPEIELICARLRQKFGSEAVLAYYGGTSSADRAIAEDRYCNDPTCRFIVGNPAAAGLGLTFISGENDIMYYYSGTFAYIDRSQSEDRSHRIGQSNSVAIVDPIMVGTIDETIAAAHAEKKDIDEYVKEKMNQGYTAAQVMTGQV